MSRTCAGIAIAYLRVSTDRQDLGPEAQRASIEAWAERAGVTVVASYFEAVSGGAPLEQRAELVAALAALERHKAGLLVVAKRDRLARDVLGAAMIDAAAARLGARVVSAAGEGTESDDPTGKLLSRIVDAFAEYERLIIRARTKGALAVKRSRGEMTGACRYGFRLSSDGVHVEPDPHEQEVITRARALRAQGTSVRGIQTLLGAVSRTGKQLTVASVHALVSGDQ